MEKRIKNLYRLAAAGLAVSGLIVLYMLFWFVYPFKPIEFLTDPVEVVEDIVYPGEEIHLLLDFCKYTDKGSTIYSKVINEEVISLPVIHSSVPPGCYEKLRPVAVPEYLHPGTYYAEVAVEYELHPLRTVVVRYTTETFVVGE